MNSIPNRIRKATLPTVVPQKAELSLVSSGQPPLLLDEAAASRFLGVSRSYLRRSRSKGKIGGETSAPPFVALSGRRLYKLSDLQTWVDSLTVHASIAELGDGDE
jgi:hypothetical protein